MSPSPYQVSLHRFHRLALPVSIHFPYWVIHPPVQVPLRRSERFLEIVARNKRTYILRARVTDMRLQSASSQTVSYLQYLISIERAKTTVNPVTILANGAHQNGTYWCIFVIDGDKSYLHHHAVSISKFPVHSEPPSRRFWVSGQPFLSLWFMRIDPILRLLVKTISLLHSGTPIVCARSGLRYRVCSLKR